jgi:hypothetical protein
MAASFPSKTNFANGEVLFATDVNQLAENVNDLNDRSKQVVTNAQTGTTYTLALADAGKLIELSNVAAITLTIPTNTSVAFPVGSRIDILATNTGKVTVAGASGVTLNSSDGNVKLLNQWSAASVVKRATDTWVLIGELGT